MNYQSLTDEIGYYLARTDAAVLNRIPGFIDNAINGLYSRARTIGFQTTITTTLTGVSLSAGNPIFLKPNVPPNILKETISFQLVIPGDDPYSTILMKKSYEFCTSYWPYAQLTETPLFYADYSDTEFYISPTPDRNYPIILTYIRMPFFNAQNPTNFLTDKYPDLLLAACMIKAAMFVRNPQLLQEWKEAYANALAALTGDTAQSLNDRSTKRDKD